MRLKMWVVILMVTMGFALKANPTSPPPKKPEHPNCQKDPTNPKCMKVWDILQTLS